MPESSKNRAIALRKMFSTPKCSILCRLEAFEDLEDEDDEDEKLGIQKTVKIYGLKSDDRPNKKIKSLTVGDVIRFRPLTCERIQTLLDILENGMKRIKE